MVNASPEAHILCSPSPWIVTGPVFVEADCHHMRRVSECILHPIPWNLQLVQNMSFNFRMMEYVEFLF